MSGFINAIGFLMLLGILLVLYLIPSWVAMSSGKRNAGAIMVLNILLGWTFIGWVVCLVWAMTIDKTE
jgi:hypothetical protein